MPTDPTFRMLVKDVFSIAGRGLVVTGEIASGTLRTGDEVILRGGGGDRKTTVAGLEGFKKVIQEAKAGDQVGVLLAGLKKGDVAPGYELLGSEAAA